MPKMKIVYIHFESKPALERLGRYFTRYPGYQKIFATSYSFTVPYAVPNAELRDWAHECFPCDEYVLCHCLSVYTMRENDLGRLETQEERNKFLSELDGDIS